MHRLVPRPEAMPPGSSRNTKPFGCSLLAVATDTFHHQPAFHRAERLAHDARFATLGLRVGAMDRYQHIYVTASTIAISRMNSTQP